MTPWSSFYRRVTAPIRLDHTVPPADVVPLRDLLGGRDVVMVETPESAELEQAARLTHAARIVHRTLVAESLKVPELRNMALTDLCLELRSTLRPSAPGSEVLREVPSAGIRYAVPVVPGRAA
jgi:hypothetical protein